MSHKHGPRCGVCKTRRAGRNQYALDWLRANDGVVSQESTPLCVSCAASNPSKLFGESDSCTARDILDLTRDPA